ncbi:MAG TPA: ABC transporter permease [Candidatus Babeliales bacterium]|nr:ABC transporter permease [Candidatus Babeliales bacterium]
MLTTNNYLTTVTALLKTELLVYRQIVVDKFIDVAIWVILTMVITSYILPLFGLKADFGVFQLGGVLAAVGLFEVYVSNVELIADYTGDRIIDYYLTLPLPASLVILSKALYYFLVNLSLTLLVFPLGKLCLWQQLDLSQVHYPKLLLAIILACAFYAGFVIWSSSITPNMHKLGSVWSRLIFPMWFLGGFQFSWSALHHVFPWLAYLNLLNPMLYITEALRVSLLGQADYLNFWLCLLAITSCASLCFLVGYRNLKRRLDFV